MAPAAGKGAAMSKKRALVAEDSSYILFGLEILLEHAGVEIVGAAATVAGLRRLIETMPADIAILDVNLSGEMVFPAADLLIERGVPVIFTTGYAPAKIFPPRFMSLPILQKPYDADQFVSLVKKALAESREGR
jgi:two-component system, chemotaxis family, sensor kinase Cph1